MYAWFGPFNDFTNLQCYCEWPIRDEIPNVYFTVVLQWYSGAEQERACVCVWESKWEFFPIILYLICLHVLL